MENQRYKLPNVGLFQFKPALRDIWDEFKFIAKPITEKYPSREIELRLNLERSEIKCVSGDLSPYELDKLLIDIQEKICKHGP